MNDLRKQYNKTLRELERLKANAPEADEKIITGMISDVRYALEWMRTARQPNLRRGIERRSAYQRTIKMNPLHMQQYLKSLDMDMEFDEQEEKISHWDQVRLEDALSRLTEREKEIYVMNIAGMMSQEEIAYKLNISRRTVRTTLDRAKDKIQQQLEGSLFCISG